MALMTGGNSAPMTKMSEMNASGSSVPRAMPVPACADVTNVDTASPTTAKHTVATASVSTAAGSPDGYAGW
jgi:hypothetical protein